MKSKPGKTSVDSSVAMVHNGAFQPHDLLDLFKSVGFNRLNEWKIENLEDIFRHTDHYIVALKAGKLVGFVRLLTDWHIRGYISNVCVHPEYQKKGVGKALMREILDLCDEKGILVLNVYDTADSPGFYEDFGFKTEANAIGMHRINSMPRDESYES